MSKRQAKTREEWQTLGRSGGAATLAKYGPEHFAAAGRKGGSATAARYGHRHYVVMGRKGGQRARELLAQGRALEAGAGPFEARAVARFGREWVEALERTTGCHTRDGAQGPPARQPRDPFLAYGFLEALDFDCARYGWGCPGRRGEWDRLAAVGPGALRNFLFETRGLLVATKARLPSAMGVLAGVFDFLVEAGTDAGAQGVCVGIGERSAGQPDRGGVSPGGGADPGAAGAAAPGRVVEAPVGGAAARPDPGAGALAAAAAGSGDEGQWKR